MLAVDRQSDLAQNRSWLSKGWQFCAPALVLLAAAVCAADLYAEFRSSGQFRWGGIDNDRNSHYLKGLQLGLDLRHGDLWSFLDDFRKIRTWPPLHALLVALAVFAGGPHYEIAVLPNLGAWVGTVLLVFLVARRAAPRAGNLAGLTAAAFALASPAHRVFATDLMLESLGAMLTLSALHLYLAYRQSPGRDCRWLAVSLTLLFFEKYNYWCLALLAIAGAESWARRERLLALAVQVARSRVAWDWLARQWRQPLNYVVLGLVALCFTLAGSVPRTVDLLGLKVKVGGSSENLWNFAYLASVLRVIVGWKTEGRLVWSQFGAPARQMALAHVLPLAVWFMLPKRLGYFIWYMGAGNGPNSDGRWTSAMGFYWGQAVEHYHLGVWHFAMALVLTACGAFALRRLRPGAAAILFLLVLGIVLTVNHPNRKSRFLHTWIAAGWAGAGVGLACLAGTGPLAPGKRLRTLMAASLAAGIVASEADGFRAAGHSPERGHFTGHSSLRIAESYLPWLANADRAAIFATLPAPDFCQWTYLETYPDRALPDVGAPWFGTSAEQNRERFANWLATTHVEKIVLIEIPPDSSFYFPDFDHYRQFRELMSQQSRYRLAARHEPNDLGCTITLWTPAEIPALAAR